MVYATVDDVAAELGRPTDSVTESEDAQWSRWIARVERAIAARFARAGLDLVEQVLLNDPASGTVGDVVSSVVARKVDNPDGSTSTTVSIDDGSVTRRRDGLENVGPLDLTAGEWALLLPGTADGAFSTRPSFVADYVCPDEWLTLP